MLMKEQHNIVSQAHTQGCSKKACPSYAKEHGREALQSGIHCAGSGTGGSTVVSHNFVSKTNKQTKIPLSFHLLGPQRMLLVQLFSLI